MRAKTAAHMLIIKPPSPIVYQPTSSLDELSFNSEDNENLSVITNASMAGKPSSPNSVISALVLDEDSLADDASVASSLKSSKLMRNGITLKDYYASKQSDAWGLVNKLEVERARRVEEERCQQQRQARAHLASLQRQQILAKENKKREEKALEAYYEKLAAASRLKAEEEHRQREAQQRDVRSEYIARSNADLAAKHQALEETRRREASAAQRRLRRNRELQVEDRSREEEKKAQLLLYRQKLQEDVHRQSLYKLDEGEGGGKDDALVLRPIVSSYKRKQQLQRVFQQHESPLNRQLAATEAHARRVDHLDLDKDWDRQMQLQAEQRQVLVAQDRASHEYFLSRLHRQDEQAAASVNARNVNRISYQRDLQNQIDSLHTKSLNDLVETMSIEEKKINSDLLRGLGVE